MLNIHKRIGVGLVGAAMAVAGGVVAAVPASADIGECPAERFCVWFDGQLIGQNWSTVVPSTVTPVNVPSWLHDEGSSWANLSSFRRVCVYDWVRGVRVTLDTVPPLTARPVTPPNTNDRIDAVGFC